MHYLYECIDKKNQPIKISYGTKFDFSKKKDDRAPGFFTPFSSDASLTKALASTITCPVHFSIEAIRFLLDAVVSLAESIEKLIHFDFSGAYDSVGHALNLISEAIKFALMAAISLPYEVAAVATRSFATVAATTWFSSKDAELDTAEHNNSTSYQS